MEIRHNEEGWWIGPYPDYLDAELDIEALNEFIGDPLEFHIPGPKAKSQRKMEIAYKP